MDLFLIINKEIMDIKKLKNWSKLIQNVECRGRAV